MHQPSSRTLQRLAARLATTVLIGSATIAHSQTATPAPASPAASPAASLPLVAASRAGAVRRRERRCMVCSRKKRWGIRPGA